MAQIYYETSPAPAVDGTNIVHNANGKLDLGTSVTSKLSAMTVPQSTDNGKVLTAKNDGTTEWKDAEGGIKPSDMLSSISAVETNTTSGKVVDALVVKAYSNMYTNRVILNGGTAIAEGETYIGTWDSATESDWEYSTEFIPQANEEIDLSFMFEVVDENSTPVFLGGYQWDTTTGKICIKFGSPLASATRIAVNVTHMRKG